MRAAKAIAVLALFAVTLTGCVSIGASRTSADRAGAMDGVWRSEGYGWIFEVRDGQAQKYDVTAISCLPTKTLTQLGPADADGTVRFAGKSGTVSTTLRGLGGGRAVARLTGTVADIDLVALPALPDACTRKTPTDPLTTFDVFWTTFSENYNSLVRKHVDWPAVRAHYRPLVDTTSRDQLYQILVDMVAPLGDAHVCIEGPRHKSFCGKRPGTRDDTDLSRRAAAKSVDAHLRDDLAVATIETFANDKIAYADLPGGYGYLRISSFQGYGGGDDSRDNPYPNAAALSQALDAVFTPARVAAWHGLIIDVRWNDGGDDALGLQIAGRLTNAAYPAYTKQARIDPSDPTRYGPPHPVTVTPANEPRYTGPVRLLTSDLTVSAGETFTEALMGRTPAPSRIGTTTQGVFADDMDRALPNGWSFTLGNEDYITSDGHNYEGTGIPPTREVPVFTPDQLAQHIDPALDALW